MNAKVKVIKILLLCASICAFFMMSACSNKSTGKQNGKIKITYWASMGGADSETMQKMVYAFNTSQDKYVLDAQFITSDYYKKVDLTIANNMKGMPDVMICHSDRLATYAGRDILAPISELGQSKLLVKDAYSSTAWKAGNYKGVQYGIPLDIHGPVLYWNKDLFKNAGLNPNRPPKTMREFLEFAQKTTRGKSYGFVMNTDFINEFILESLVEQEGSSFFKENGRPNFNSKEMKRAVQFEFDLIHKYNITPKKDYDEVGNFLRGNVAMIFNGPWTSPTFRDTKLHWGMAEFPQFYDKKQAVTSKSHQFVIPKTLQKSKREGVKAFLEFMNKNSMDWADSGQAPASKKVYESPEFQKKPQVAMANQFDRAVFTPQIDSVSLYTQMLYAQVTDILYGRKSIDKALARAQKDAMGMYKAEHVKK